MGYNTDLSEKQNKKFSNGKTTLKNARQSAHPLWILGTILRIIALLILVPFSIMMIGAGGWGIFLLLSPFPLIGLLMLAFGQYFVSNWKNK